MNALINTHVDRDKTEWRLSENTHTGTHTQKHTHRHAHTYVYWQVNMYFLVTTKIR